MGCVTVHKIILLIGIVILLTTSAALLFIGSFIVNISGTVKDLYQSTHVLIPTVIILAIGILLAILGLLGFFGCILEKKTLLFIFFTVLCLIFVAELSAVVIGFVLKLQIKEKVEFELNRYLSFYYKETSLKNEIDYIQSTMKCCGVNNYTDWTDQNLTVPSSCCDSGNCTAAKSLNFLSKMLLPHINTAYNIGCAEKVENFIKNKFVYIIVSVAAIILIQIVSLIAACGIICGKKRTEYQQFNNGLHV